MLSAARFRRPDADWRIVLYTDRRELFTGLPVDIRAIDHATAARWIGGHGYVYRAKIFALADSLAAPDACRSVLVDGDTYFRRSPAQLFRRITPGRTLMHVWEGHPAPDEAAALRKVAQAGPPVDKEGRPWGIRAEESLWNSGVVGLHRADAPLCDEVVSLTDQLLDSGFGELSHTAEMVAFGVVLERRSRLRACYATVAHYWPAEVRLPFLELLQDAWADGSRSDQQRFHDLWPQRPRQAARAHAKTVAKGLLRRVGYR